jgi:hypothetical protein
VLVCRKSFKIYDIIGNMQYINNKGEVLVLKVVGAVSVATGFGVVLK